MERGLHHEVHGTGEPLLLVHGTGSSLRVWDPVVDCLAARRTVIAVDLPGCGHVPTYDDDPALVAEVILGGSACPRSGRRVPLTSPAPPQERAK